MRHFKAGAMFQVTTKSRCMFGARVIDGQFGERQIEKECDGGPPPAPDICSEHVSFLNHCLPLSSRPSPRMAVCFVAPGNKLHKCLFELTALGAFYSVFIFWCTTLLVLVLVLASSLKDLHPPRKRIN